MRMRWVHIVVIALTVFLLVFIVIRLGVVNDVDGDNNSVMNKTSTEVNKSYNENTSQRRFGRSREEYSQNGVMSQRGSVEPIEKLTPSMAYSEVNKLFTEHESKRARLLSTTRHGNEMWYLLGVEPPDASEVKSIRKKLAEIQSKLSKQDTQQLDDIIRDLINNYDPFGILGQRAMLIKVPEDPGGRIRGMTFDSDGFDADVAKFSPSAPENYTFRNYVEFFREDGKIPERFEALLKLPDDEGN